MAARPQYGQGMKVPVPRRCLPKTQQRVGTLLSPTSYGTDEELWNLLEEVGIIEVGGTMCECGEFVEVASEERPAGARCKMCRKTANLRNGTELDGVRLVRGFIAVIDGWILNLPMRAIGALTGLSPGTVRKYWRRLDAMAEKVFSRMDAAGAFKVGGEGVIVEVDEWWVMKEKDGTDVWVVGVIEREVTIDGRGATARKVAFLIVKRRDAETLTNFIVDRVWGGSILISDSWRGYTAFLQRMDTHCVVNHSVEYGKTAVVGGVTLRINTNHIEREWVEVRKALRRKPFRTYRAGLMRESYRQWFLSGLGADASRLQVLRDLGRLSTEGRERRQ